MVWAGSEAHETTAIVSIQGRLNSETYAENVITEAPLIIGGDYLFQQDNASCHLSCVLRS